MFDVTACDVAGFYLFGRGGTVMVEGPYVVTRWKGCFTFGFERTHGKLRLLRLLPSALPALTPRTFTITVPRHSLPVSIFFLSLIHSISHLCLSLSLRTPYAHTHLPHTPTANL